MARLSFSVTVYYFFSFLQFESSPRITASPAAAGDSKALARMGGGGDEGGPDCSQKRSAFSQYIQLVKNIREYEKDNFQEFTAYGTRTVNSVLKRNILKLEFCEPVYGEDIPKNY